MLEIDFLGPKITFYRSVCSSKENLIVLLQGQNNLPSRRGPSLAQRYGRYQGTGIPRKQPTLTTEKTLRIYVRRDGNLPILMDCLLRFAWILNLIGWSGIVLHCLTKLHVSLKRSQNHSFFVFGCILQTITERVHIEKRYGPRRQSSSLDDDSDVQVQIRGKYHYN